jgi:carbonic anhydrase
MRFQRRPLVLAEILALSVLVGGAAAAAEFSYSGDHGPSHWGQLDPGFAACGTGGAQSPVDFASGSKLATKSADLPVTYRETEGEIFNNGHTIEVETKGDNALVLDGVRYELVQFHIHTPSEHTVKGRGYDMELHLVHRSADGKLAVIGVMLERGKDSGALAPIFASLPDEAGPKHPLKAPFNPADFLPKSREHLRYAGSLTTPPCSEGVRWFVLLGPMTVSNEDMARVAERLKFNARPVQRKL